MSVVAAAQTQTSELTTALDYLGLGPEQRYRVVSQRFPKWLLMEPIEFPRNHPTYGWACRVNGCDAAMATTETRQLCVQHARACSRACNGAGDVQGLEEFLASAQPSRSQRIGWALTRRQRCRIDGCPREIDLDGCCKAHGSAFRRARARKEFHEMRWAADQSPMPAFKVCRIDGCVHDGAHSRILACERRNICPTHAQQFDRWLQSPNAILGSWADFLAFEPLVVSLVSPDSRGRLSLAKLPTSLQREVRYALHRHTNTARRTQWRPASLQTVVDVLANAGVQSLADPEMAQLTADHYDNPAERRIWLDLPAAARSLSCTPESAKAAGWFDPALVGAKPFTGSQGNRVKPWDLTAVTQRWLRDLLWEHLADEAQLPSGKQVCYTTIHSRIGAVALLSRMLEQNRPDHGNDPEALGKSDAEAVKRTWDLWLHEQIPLPVVSAHTKSRILTENTRMVFTMGVRSVLGQARQAGRTSAAMDMFILNLPEYARSPRKPRPRPLSYGDFQLLISPESLRALDALDFENVGFSDIWMTQAFQGGRISETLRLKLGCVGLIGAAQPYLWRDIAKVGVVDYGMPCYRPVYERLLQRREITLAKLRVRYHHTLVELDKRGRARLEASWDREMPLFPRVTMNPDLSLEVSQCWFRQVWTEWFGSLGLSEHVTCHQTRATLATSLLNNGAPAALVRQLLGHFSEEALAHYANYSNTTMTRHLQQIWAAGPGMDKPGTILLRPAEVKADSPATAAARIDLTVVPTEHGLCRYGPVVGGSQCPWSKNCTDGPKGPCEHFVLTGADLAYWERKRDAAFHFAEGAPTDEARDYILSQWAPWEPVLTGLRDALDELGLLEEAEKLDLRVSAHDYFSPVFATGWRPTQLSTPGQANKESETR